MSKILILGATGGGKSTSIGKIPKLNIEGLNPKETFIIGCSNKALPFAGWKRDYPRAKANIVSGVVKDITPTGNYYVSNVGSNVAELIRLINEKRTDIKNILIDDANYMMQDFYMQNALKGGYDVFKKIGLFMGKVFNAIEEVDAADKNVIMMAHFEEYKAKNSDRISFRFKTVGNMVQSYITPEGKFEIVLFADQVFDDDAPSIPVGLTTARWGALAAYGMRGTHNTKRIYGTRGNSFVAVVEFGDSVKAKSILAGGQSGDPDSPHFFDQAQDYADIRFKDVAYYREDVLKRAKESYHPGERK